MRNGVLILYNIVFMITSTFPSNCQIIMTIYHVINALTWRKRVPVSESEGEEGTNSSRSLVSVHLTPPFLRLYSSLQLPSLTRGCLEASLLATPLLGKSVRKMSICVAVEGRRVRRLLSLELINSLISFDLMFPACSNQITGDKVTGILPQ